MEQVPDFWRTEVFHPLSVHFSIAPLLAAFAFKLMALKYYREVWELGGRILLISWNHRDLDSCLYREPG